MTDHLPLPYPIKLLLSKLGSAMLGRNMDCGGLMFFLASQIVNDDHSGCWRGALGKGENDSAPCTVFMAGHPGHMGHGAEEDLCMLLEQKH